MVYHELQKYVAFPELYNIFLGDRDCCISHKTNGVGAPNEISR
jgi:hypothetical protein